MSPSTTFGRALFAACLVFAAHAAEAASSLKLVYQPSGVTRTYSAPTAVFHASGNTETVSLYVESGSEWYFIDIAAPRGQSLARGTYSKAERSSFRSGRAPGLDIGGNGSGCNEVWGSFVIRQIGFDESGELSMLDATLTQNCEAANGPKVTATVLFNAEPWSYSYASSAGDYIGAGRKKTFLGHTSDFGISGSANYFHYSVSGDREDWMVTLAPPTGTQWAVGTYPAQRFAGPGVAGLSATGNGRGCNTSTGTLVIKDIEINASNVVTGLYATFTQYCEGPTAPPYKGTIRYFK